jgi:predicted RNA binding protein YcfA (HicA-like mRNA interferase family)
MPKLYRPRQVIRILESLGWRVVRQRGSHVRLALDEGQLPVTVPVSAREVDRRTMRNILNQAGLSKETFDKVAEEVL